jgi:hypothetical protein
MMPSLLISALQHTWLIDIDGTILKHNGHKMGGDELLPGVRSFWASIPEDDVIILLSARTHEEMPATLAFLDAQGIRYDHALFGMPKGERIVINDGKPGGLSTAVAVNVKRDEGLANLVVIRDPTL